MKILTGLAMAATLFAATGVATAESPPPATTPDKGTMMDCSEAGMTDANNSMMKMSDPAKKEAMMKEMGMAKDMMAKKDMPGCKMHMDKAMDMMK